MTDTAPDTSERTVPAPRPPQDSPVAGAGPGGVLLPDGYLTAAERGGEHRAPGAVERLGGAVERAGDAAGRAAAASGRAATSMVERLRNNAELVADRGRTTIANEVVEKIAGIAARDVPGVYDLGGDVARFFAAVRERVGLDQSGGGNRGVSVRLQGRAAQVDLTLVIEYGFVVHSVTETVRAKVIGAVENLLGLEVTEVNIVVDDVHVADDGGVGGDEGRAEGYRV